MPSQSIALPEAHVWEFRDRAGVTRTFEQNELKIDGEVRLVQLAGATIKRLTEAGFPWQDVTKVFAEDGSILWDKASDMLMLAVSEVPELVAESTMILFELHPKNEDGTRNKEYDTDKAFIRRAINMTRWIEIVMKFTEQNDYERLARPFSLAATRAMEAGMMIAREQQIRSNNLEDSSKELTDSLSQDTDTQALSSED